MRFMTQVISAAMLVVIAAPVLAHGHHQRCSSAKFYTDGHGKRHKCPAIDLRDGHTNVAPAPVGTDGHTTRRAPVRTDGHATMRAPVTTENLYAVTPRPLSAAMPPPPPPAGSNTHIHPNSTGTSDGHTN